MLTNSQQQKNIFNICHKAIFISWLSSMLIQISKAEEELQSNPLGIISKFRF